MGMVHLWELEEASGTRTDEFGLVDLDKAFNDNNTVAQPGKVGNALNADSNLDGRYNNTDATVLSGKDDATITAWVYPLSFPAAGSLIAIAGIISNRIIGMLIQGDRTLLGSVGRTSGTISITSGSPLTANAWHHIAVTAARSGDTKIYINGNLDGTDGTATGALNSETGMYVGSTDTNSMPADAYIDQVALFDEELSQATISSIYNNGNGRSILGINNRNKRASTIGKDLPFARIYPNPDGTISEKLDRLHMAYNYRFGTEVGAFISLLPLMRVG